MTIDWKMTICMKLRDPIRYEKEIVQTIGRAKWKMVTALRKMLVGFYDEINELAAKESSNCF